MAINNYFKDKSIWGLLMVWSFLGSIAMGIVFIPFFVLWRDMPDGLFRFLTKTVSWGLPILMAIFVFSSAIRKKEIMGSFKVVPEGEQEKKEKHVNPYPEETKRYYKRWGRIGLICLLVFMVFSAVLFVLNLFFDIFHKFLFIIDWSILILACVGIGIYLKGDSKGVFFKSTEKIELKGE